MKNLKNIKILYVEDDVNTNEEVSLFLGQFTDFLYVAFDGEAGLLAFKEYRPDIVITDVQMPLMNGLEMIKGIKEIDENVFVLVTTAFNETQYLLQAINLGISKYLLKPLNLKELFEALNEYFSKLSERTLYQSLDEQGNILEVNGAWLEYLGYEEEEVLGKFFGDFIDKESAEQFEVNFLHLIKEGFATNIRFFIKKKNGTYVDISLNAVAIYEAGGKFKKTSCELTHIGLLMRLQENIEKSLENEKYLKSLVTTHVHIISAIVNASSSEKFLSEVCNAFRENSAYELIFIALLKNQNKLTVAAQSLHSTINVAQIMGETFEMDANGTCTTCRTVKENKIIIVDNIQKLGDFKLKESFVDANIESVISVPLVLKSSHQLMGAITLTFQQSHVFQKDELEFFHNISETIAFGLQTIKDKKEKENLLLALHRQATTDALTLCANRHKGKEFLQEELKRAQRYGRDLALIFFDIDDFKKINDYYGHDVGDKVLVEVANCVKEYKRSSDVGVRWGGEEFLVILPESNVEGAVVLAEKLRTAFKALKFEGAFSVTASFGVVGFNKKEDWDTLVKRADDLMYAAKKSTKDKVVCQ
jgi:diguanylate cyclase (GGDEF)-like protein/PAS domain S-box-containing protein